MHSFLTELRTQRWDDHRYYHHSRINQSLHLLSAVSFLVAYVMMFKDPVAAALIGWLVSMVSRQSGHFFFEPKGYDEVNQATHEHKEAIKVGYNLKRKVILHAVWALVPLLVWLNPTFFGVFAPASGGFVRHVGEIWLFVGIGALAVPNDPSVLPAGRSDRARVADEDHHRPVQRREALLQVAALPAARRADRARRERRAGLKHFLEHAALDGLVGGGGLGPPPAVRLHRPGGRYQPLGDLRELRGRVVQAENQAAGAHPAQGDAGLA